MLLQEEVLIPRDQETVFDALNDIEILQASIPGCEEVTQLSDEKLKALIVVKFGPVKASFSSNVTLDRSGAPDKFIISGSGDAGSVGSATGGADVSLRTQGGETLLSYEVKIDVVGKLAQIGSRLMEGTTKRIIKKFFANFEQQLLEKNS